MVYLGLITLEKSSLFGLAILFLEQHNWNNNMKTTFYKINESLLLNIAEEEIRLSKDSSNFTSRKTLKNSVRNLLLNMYSTAIVMTYFQRKSSEDYFTFTSKMFKKKLGCRKTQGFYRIMDTLNISNLKYTSMRYQRNFYKWEDDQYVHVNTQAGPKIDYDEQLLEYRKTWVNRNNIYVEEFFEEYQSDYVRNTKKVKDDDGKKCKKYFLEGDETFLDTSWFIDETFFENLIVKVNWLFNKDILKAEKEIVVENIYKNVNDGLSITNYFEKKKHLFKNKEELQLMLNQYGKKQLKTKYTVHS
jgi:hypothetical protein